MKPGAGRILFATLAAAAVAALLLVAFVLPAEYGIDPLRTGSVLGLTALAQAGANRLEPQPEGLRRDGIEFVLGAYETVEYKYRLPARAAMLYSWTATGEVIFDFHTEPEGAPEGFSESFQKGRSTQLNGAYNAPYSGIHGWFWENPGSRPVTIRLTSAGFYTEAIEFNASGPRSYPLGRMDGR